MAPRVRWMGGFFGKKRASGRKMELSRDVDTGICVFCAFHLGYEETAFQTRRSRGLLAPLHPRKHDRRRHFALGVIRRAPVFLLAGRLQSANPPGGLPDAALQSIWSQSLTSAPSSICCPEKRPARRRGVDAGGRFPGPVVTVATRLKPARASSLRVFERIIQPKRMVISQHPKRRRLLCCR